jgi:polyisoprenoid-binding protein YceI
MNKQAAKFMRGLAVMAVLGLMAVLAACGASSNSPESTTATTTNTTAQSQPSGAASSSGTASVSTDGAQSVTLNLVAGQNSASYRVREQLARLSFPSDAVGTTKAVSGQVVANADGSIVSQDSKFTVDLSSLVSDSSMRDGFIQMNVLQTNKYPTATFVPTSVQGLSLPPTDGDLAFKLVGDLTIHGVTKQVTWDVAGTLSGDKATGTATTSFTFADFGLTKPSVGSVLSVADTIKLELNLSFAVAPQA